MKTLYFIGNDESKEKNQYLALTPDKELAQVLLENIEGATQIIEVDIGYESN